MKRHVCLSVCHEVGAAAAGPIIPQLGQQTLLFDTLRIRGVRGAIRGLLEADTELQSCIHYISTHVVNRNGKRGGGRISVARL